MTSEKLTRKEIKSPDAFLRGVHGAGDWMVDHRKFLGLGAVVLVVGLVVVSLVIHFQHKKIRESGNALSSAIAVGERSVQVAGEKAAPGVEEQETFASYRERENSFAKSLQEVGEKHSGTPSARTSQLALASSEYRLKKFDTAISIYQKYLAETPKEDGLRAEAWEGLGYAFEAQNDLDKAVDALDNMGRETSDQSVPVRVAFHKARILEKKGKKQEAANAFSKVKEESKESLVAEDASARLALLGMEGIFPSDEKKIEKKK